MFTHKEYDRWNEKQRDKEVKEYAQRVKEFERRRKKADGKPGKETRS